ncbi:MAG: leucyl/phenylalanyl-tRNA--protein transferase [Treponema sp.]|nr:leucyl/phenylalanyl-tRNA--protein transferase [Treponema sp.]
MHRTGPDLDFPRLSEHGRFAFPSPETWTGWVVAVGGNLSPGMLLSAYEQGIFPWYNPEDPLLWQSPDPRLVIFQEKLHLSASMTKILKRKVFEIAFDRDFEGVIRGCARAARPGQDGTWISEDIIAAYTELHRLGWAHSAEARQGGELAGGCYGIGLGNAFFGESMFAEKPNASKAAFLTLARTLFADRIRFIDCQVHTDHLASLGGEEISRGEYLSLLKKALAVRRYAGGRTMDRRGNWGERYGMSRVPAGGSTAYAD